MTLNKEQKAERDRRIVNSRLAGASFQQIAATLEVSVGLAHKVVKAHLSAIEEVTRMDAEAIRVQEAARLDQLQAALWAPAMKGNVGASQQVLRVMERRAKMLGLDQSNDDAARLGAVAGAAAATAARSVDSLTTEEAVARYRDLVRKV